MEWHVLCVCVCGGGVLASTALDRTGLTLVSMDAETSEKPTGFGRG